MLFSGALSSRRSDEKSERSIYLLRDVMELATTENRGHSENGTGCKQIPSPLGSQSPFTVAARGSHAGSKSPWPLESKKPICVVDRCS